MKVLFIWIFFFLVPVLSLTAQQRSVSATPSDTTYRFKLTNGSEIFGKITGRTDSTLTIDAKQIGAINVKIKDIEEQSAVADKDFRSKKYWFKNPNATRYIISPSAIPLKAGEGYYQNTLLFLNSFNVGLTNHVSIGGGFEILSLLIEGEPIFYLTPKVGFKAAKNFHLAAGMLYVSVPSFSNNETREGGGVFFGSATYGNDDHNLTLSAGYGFTGEDISGRPIFTISGMTRLSRKIGLITENWIVPSSESEYDPNFGVEIRRETYNLAYSYGLRFMGESISVDLAFVNTSESNLTFGFPVVDFVVKFGK